MEHTRGKDVTQSLGLFANIRNACLPVNQAKFFRTQGRLSSSAECNFYLKVKGHTTISGGTLSSVGGSQNIVADHRYRHNDHIGVANHGPVNNVHIHIHVGGSKAPSVYLGAVID
ncbi:hypothetical protein BT96DRAFT_693377 [Gymnopus androsaceus JB14]|uniref:Uncharacterized protein n=1 Tax=Gymnopus androsaceus JB14 TaxID=1447944 RepID=A0A6A4HPJ4_9AGAR|nr:hypothetical protein BT96DRAFT_693377 [Gymnopus androsaceus JB14]